jgi:hypothetical protein
MVPSKANTAEGGTAAVQRALLTSRAAAVLVNTPPAGVKAVKRAFI